MCASTSQAVTPRACPVNAAAGTQTKLRLGGQEYKVYMTSRVWLQGGAVEDAELNVRLN